ncbi:MAG: response regulator [Deltaproteobacteria bacterium]|nr:response regulator [Deltaproteobacteria bacterium]
MTSDKTVILKAFRPKIMIVEDDFLFSSSLKIIVERLGYLVCCVVDSGEEAVRKAETERPDLILMDILLAGQMDGIDAAAQIQAHLEIPIVFTTGWVDEKLLQRAKLTYPAGYLLKPYENRQIEVTLEIALYVSKVEAERRKADQAVKEALTFNQRVIDTSPNLVYIFDLQERRNVFVNQMAKPILGYEPAEIQGLASKSLRQILHPDDFAASAEHLAGFDKANDGEVSEHDYRIKHADGRWVLLHSRELLFSRTKDGRPHQILGTAQDITELKRAEDALLEIQRHDTFLADLLETSGQPFAIGYPDGKLDAFNTAFRRLIGYSREELATIDWGRDLTPPEWLPGELVKLEELHRTGQPVRYEKEYIRKDGSRVPVELLVHLVRDEGGQPIYYYAFVTDITDRKLAEHALVKAKIEAESANRAKSEFLANMSHEIRTPMNAIIGMLRLALETDLNPQQREYLEAVEKSSGHLLIIINDILDLSKIEAGKFELVPGVFQLRPSLANIMGILSSRAEEKGIELIYHFKPEIDDTLVGDVSRLGQIIYNLVGNAIKFTTEGEVLLQVGIESWTDEEVVLRFAVTDTGCGIPLDKQQAIFAPFAQADASTTKKYGGTGLGLAISKRLVQMMGGDVSVNSEPNQGSTFEFTSRFKRNHLPEAEVQPPPAKDIRPAPDAVAKPVGALRILLVEDNLVNQKLALVLLERHGHTVVIAGDGQKALAAWEKEPFDIILMDIQMPVMDGLKATAAIRAHERQTGRHIPIVAMTAYAMTGDKQRCIDAGMDDYLSKPINIQELYQVIARTTKTLAD